MTMMSPSLKIAGMVVAQLALFSNQVLAYLPEITFEQPVYTPLDLVDQDPQDAWESLYGTSTVTAAGQGYGGTGQALKIAADADEEAWLRKPIAWNSAESIAFIDFRIKPAAAPSGSQANFVANGTQIAFQIPSGSNLGELWVLHGNDGASGEPLPPEQWYQTPGKFTVAGQNTVATEWIRATLRHDYGRDIWDLFIDGKLAAVNLGFEGRGPNLQALEFFGSKVGDTLIDNVRADPTNMLFPDADKDGLPDAWETANGSNPNLYDRDAIDPVTGKSFLDKYLDSLWNTQTPGTPVNGSGGTGNIGSIPPLTILHAHQPVGALKGSLTVGGDGSASYSIPIDIPKGTAGMEPKISLNYSSSGGNGLAGLGWSLSGLQQIVRGGSSYYKDGVVDGVDFDDKDRFFLDGERLICVGGTYGAPGSEYRTEMDSFARITAVGGEGSGAVPGPSSWKVETKAGLTVYLGQTAESKVAKAGGVLSWSVTRAEDSLGNYYKVDYQRVIAAAGQPFPGEVRNQRVTAIHYTGQGTADNTYATVHFDYETRPDKRVFFSSGVRQFFDQRLKTIRVTTNTSVPGQAHENHRYELRYATSQQTGRSLLTEVGKIAAGIEIPPTRFEWQTLGHGDEKWVEADNSLKVEDYGNDFDSRDGVTGMISPTVGDPTQVHLTGAAWRAIPLDRTNLLPQGQTYYQVTANTVLDFEYRAGPLPTYAMIGLDEDTLSSGAGRLIKLVGGNNPPGGVVATSLYTYNASNPQYQRKQISLGLITGYVGKQMKYLVLVNDDVAINDGVGESWFRNLRVYESPTNPDTVAPLDFSGENTLANTVPQMVTNQGSDLGLRINDFTGDGRADLIYRTFYNKYGSGAGDGVNFDIYGQVMLNGRHGFETFPTSTFQNLISGIKGSSLDAPWARRADIQAVPVDINADGKTDYCYPRNVYKPSTYVLGHGHGFMTWTPTGWSDRGDWALPFSSQSNVNFHRFNHFQFTDLNGDRFPDAVVHVNSGNLMNDQNGADGNAGTSISTAGSAWINRIGTGGTWEQSTSHVLPMPLKVIGVANGELGRRIFDANADGLPDVIQSRSVEAKEVWLNTPAGFVKEPAGSKYELPIYLTNGNGDDVGSRLVDLNGDGLVDAIKDLSYGGAQYPTAVHLNTGDGWQQVADGSGSISPDSWNLPDLNFSTFDKYEEDHTGQSSMTDVNADGLIDIVVARFDQDNYVYINTGTTWWRSDNATFWAGGTQGEVSNRFAVPEPIYRSATGASTGKAVGTFADINGDGVADYISDMDTPTPRVWINQCGPELIEAVTDGFDARLEVEYTNLNDPTPRGPADKPTYTAFEGTLPANHIGVIHGGKVVTRLKESDGLGGYRATCRYYGDYRFDRNNEASLGFGWTEVHDEHFPAGGGYVNRGYTRTETRRDYPFAGSPAVVRSYIHVTAAMAHQPGVTPGTKMVSEEVADYGHIPGGIAPIATNAGGTIKRPVQISSVARKWHLDRAMSVTTAPVIVGGQVITPAGVLIVSNEGTLLSQVTTSQPAASFDPFGFLTQSTVSALDGTVTVTSNYYWHGTAPGKWWLGRLLSSQVAKSKSSENVTKKTAFQYHHQTGLLVAEYLEPTGSYAATGSVVSTSAPATTIGHSGLGVSAPSDPFPGGVKKTYTHDTRGNVEESSVTAYTGIASGATTQTRTSKTEWSHNGRFPSKQTTGFGTAFAASVEQFYDPLSALVVASIDIDGRATAFGYDSFGTRITTARPDGTVSAEVTRHVSNADLPAAIRGVLASHGIVLKWARSAQSSGTPWATVYLDVLGREIVNESVVLTATEPSVEFRHQYQVTLYDTRGRKYKASNPFHEGDAIHWTAIEYDVLDRPVKTLHPDGTTDGILSISAVAHASDPRMHTVLFNKRYHPSTAPQHFLERWEDQHGRLVASKDASGRTTTFDHDLEGRLTEVHIAAGRQLTNTYEPKFGHKVSTDDISGGVSHSRVNGFGDVIKSTNARGDETITTYDAIGRVSSVAGPEDTFVTTYRTAGPAKGAPATITSSITGYQESFAYGDGTQTNDYGKVISATKQQSAAQGSYTSETTYNALGLVLTEKDAGGLTVVHDYDPEFGSFKLRTRLAGPRPALLSQMVSVGATATRLVTTEKLVHGVTRVTETDSRNGRLMRIESKRGAIVVQDLTYTWDPNGNLLTRTDGKTGSSGSTETFGYDTLDRLDWSQVSGQSQVDYAYETNGNLVTKGNTTLDYTGGGYRVASAKVKGAASPNRTYGYDAAGHVLTDSKRTLTWTSSGHLKEVYQVSCPALDTFAATGTFVANSIPGIPSWAVYSASQARATFEFDAAGSRTVQSLLRTYANGNEKRCITRYLGSYEIEEHESRPNATGTFVRDKTLHRHSLGSALYTSEIVGTAAAVHRLAVVLTDHIGSTDVIVRGQWQATGWTVNGTDSAALNQAAAERQSFDAWGDRRSAANWSELRATDAANRQTSAMDHDRGFTGHEMLDDFGLVHMNGRIYDPEIGRFLSPDPYVQVPEYSQSFNRYTYVLNNPLSLTDPSGNSWVGDNWLSIVVMVVVAVVSWGVGSAFIAAGEAAFAASGAAYGTSLTAFTTVTANAAGTTFVGLSATGMAAVGGIAGAVGGGLNAAISGGDGGDILRGALVGAIQGAVAGGVLHGLADGSGFDSAALHVAGHGTIGGAANEAMGGKFQDGFLSAAASSAAGHLPGVDRLMGSAGDGAPVKAVARTVTAAVIGGTASALGGGKFANGAFTAAMQFILNDNIDDALTLVTGAADVLSFGLSKWLRDDVYTDYYEGTVNYESGAYTNGEILGVGIAIVTTGGTAGAANAGTRLAVTSGTTATRMATTQTLRAVQATAPRSGAAIVRVGQAGEAAVQAVYQIGNKARILVNGRTRIPDGMTATVLSEVKNTARMSFTRQLRDFSDYALATGRRFDLYVRPTTQLTQSLQDAVRTGLVNLRFIP